MDKPTLEPRNDHRRALAAYLLFRQAAETEPMTAVLLQDIAAALEQARRSAERG